MTAFRSHNLTAIAAALALLVVPACGGGGGGGSSTPTTPPPQADVVVVEIFDNEFVPKSITVDPGITVRWVNMGEMTDHTTTAKEGEWDSGFVFGAPGDTFEHTFTASDDGTTFEYACVTHQACCSMQGSVRVGENAPPPAPGY